jgi:uncharacterized protein (DUF58 family)
VPTKQGWTVLVGAVAAIVVGRVFGIVELFVIAAALALAVLAAVVVVRLFPALVTVVRWAHPSVLTVGDTGRVDLLVRNCGRWRSPRIALTEPVGPRNSAHLVIAALRPDEQISAGYRVPAQRRGVLAVGPTVLRRTDLLGLAADVRLGADVTELTVAPQTFELPMPSLGTGVLGRHLLALSQRVGPGEFHSLRDYVDGDEPRTIHWKASARSEGLKVRQHEAQGVRRCIVVLDGDPAAWPDEMLATDPDAFERAVTVAASVVLSGQRAGLTTRFVTGGPGGVAIDLRGPDVATNALHTLAPLAIGHPLGEFERDPGEGLGLAIVVTSTTSGPAWRLTERLGDPTLTRLGVFTHALGAGRRPRLSIEARSVPEFRAAWARLAGAPGLTTELTTDVIPGLTPAGAVGGVR